ncbi:MAG: DUF4215 domain-containing protein [Nanoarchaeota archaeon]
MRKILLLGSLLVVILFLVSCAPGDKALAGQATGALCGDAKTYLGEECDDGNTVATDYCSSQCTFTSKVLKVKVRFVKTCMTEAYGTVCTSDLQKDNYQNTLNGANDIYARSFSKIRFVVDPTTSYDFVKDNLIASRMLFNKPVSEIITTTIKDLNNDGKFDGNDAKTFILKDGSNTSGARNTFASQYPGSLVVFLLANQNLEPKYDDSSGHWIVDKASGGFSGCGGSYIAMPPGGGGGNLFAHESGHFFCTPHTFSGNRPKTIGEAVEYINGKIAKGVDPNNIAGIQGYYDLDKNYDVLDTPADPGTSLFASVYGDKCDPDLSKTVEVPVTLDSGNKVYVFQADRTNIMSYYKGCFPDVVHFSPSQVAKHHETLRTTKSRLITGVASSFAENYSDVEIEQKEEVTSDKQLMVEHKLFSFSSKCGNGIKETGEECDDGNAVNTDLCTSACKWAKCGDGFPQKPNRYRMVEECDDGNAITTDFCKSCRISKCGDGVTQNPNAYWELEKCDDGNTNNTDSCTTLCQYVVPKCGDGVVQKPNDAGVIEQCDDGNTANTDACSNSCLWAVCGDGIAQAPNAQGYIEQCDDGNAIYNDACNNVCIKTKCGDGTLQQPNGYGQKELCDDGNTVNTDSCTNTCLWAVCGDGIIQPLNIQGWKEQCDDSNIVNGDGCSSTCQLT